MNILVRASTLSLVLAATVATSAALAQVAAPAADTLFRATTLNLSAYGETRAVPDMATINLGVNTEAPTAAGAMTANAVQMNKIFAALRRAGIADKDIQTTGLNLNAQYDYVQNEPPKLRGYQASNQVTVAVRDLSRVGAALDATVTAGANQVNGISFGLADPAAATRDRSRTATVTWLLA